ncbi:MAG: hypothetical protein Q4A03_06870 [Rothia sp. (in: high G+C Gram-positive bacteria)]|uniref:hypothetical protein n=1 Tax=Rothia sp. (in: high G+C Gram-positive bacteria) TaxID=1885016 RepID=UPI002703A337|nr:hypothetical protein [Rothia sp. (in: high G+C Gram-positive bacteria)]
MSLIGVSDQGKLTMGDRTLGELAREAGDRAKIQASQIRLPEFLLFASLIYGQHVPGLGLPFNQLMIFIILGYALTRKAVFELGKWSKVFAFLGLLLAYVAVVSAFADPSEYAADWTRRLLRLLATTVLIYVIAVGQIHLRSAILGYSTALLVNAGLFFAGLAPDSYGGYLTGYLLDKNYAGLVHALFALLIMTALVKRWQQVVVLVIACFLLWETGSRTSLAALLFAYLWILLAPRLVPMGKVALLGIFWWVIGFITDDFADASVFGDRTGTDALRARIDEMSWAKVQQTGFFGQGLGEAYVYDGIQERTWFFHNSYWAAFVEGGWIWALGLVAVTLFVAVQPLTTGKNQTIYQVIGQGLGIALLICSLRLGEVFYTTPWAICMGYVIRSWVVTRYENQSIRLFGYDKELAERKI